MKYAIYGMGNAVVDVELSVPFSFLSDLGIEKGLMTLVEQTHLEELLKKASLFGYPREQTCGGSGANTIAAISHLGAQTFYNCKVAGDETGRFYLENLNELGIETNLNKIPLTNIKDQTTAQCIVMVTPDAERTMNTHLGISQTFEEKDVSWADIAASHYLYIEGYLVSAKEGQKAAMKAVQYARTQGVQTVISFSDPSMTKYFREGLEDIIGTGVDMIFCNEKESLTFTQTADLTQAIKKMQKVAKSFAITRGSQGALIWDGQKTIEVSTPSVCAVDTNGAGDLFAGAFLYALTAGHSYLEAGTFACEAASLLVSRWGSRLKKEELCTLYKKVLK